MHLKLETLDLISRGTGPKQSQTYSAVSLIYLISMGCDRQARFRERMNKKYIIDFSGIIKPLSEGVFIAKSCPTHQICTIRNPPIRLFPNHL